MRAMLLSDLITSKSSSMQMLGISLFVGVFIAISTGQLVTSVACIAAMVPFVYLFSLSVADEQNGWERFRLTLPITRRQVAYGRYLSMAVMMVISLAVAVIVGTAAGMIADLLPTGVVDGQLKLSDWGVSTLFLVGSLVQVVILLAAAFSLPLLMRFGVTTASRLVPIVLVLALSAGVAFFSNDLEQLVSSPVFQGGEKALYAIDGILTVIALGLYGASALLSGRLYEQREL